MSLTNPKNVITEERLADFYQQILPYLGGIPDILANKFNKSDLYDINSEKICGRWVDGRCLYQKVYDDIQYAPTDVKTIVETRILHSDEPDSTLKALIPTVTETVSNATASTSYNNTEYSPWHGFDGDATDDWSCAKNDTETWLQWTFDNAKYIKNFSIVNTRTHGDRDTIPKIQLQGLNASNEWEVLYESEPNTTTFTLTEVEISASKQSTLYSAVRFKQFRSNTSSKLAYVGDFKVNGYDELMYTFIRYTKSTDEPGSCVIGNDTDYSTTEKIVGTWIDGKPLYQKVVEFETALSVKYNAWTDTGITTASLNIQRLIDAKGYTNAGAYNLETTTENNAVSVQCSRNGNNVSITAMTIQYTKTTD